MPKQTRDRHSSAEGPGAHSASSDAAATGPAAPGLAASAGAGAAIGGVIGPGFVGPAGEEVGATPGAPDEGVAGRAASEPVNASEEDAYWRDNYRRRPYADDTLSYDHYRPAYRYGWESRTRFEGRRWDEVERELERGWRENRGASRLGWGDARLAARDAWQRVEHRMLDEREAREREAADPPR